MSDFVNGTAYPIDTLPDDLYDDKPASQKWAIRNALFWNDCEGWWLESIADYRRGLFGDDLGRARFWMPEPPHPMTREQILAERGMVVCPDCNLAIYRERAHLCQGKSAGATVTVIGEDRK